MCSTLVKKDSLLLLMDDCTEKKDSFLRPCSGQAPSLSPIAISLSLKDALVGMTIASFSGI
jgi:hypothetical protein